MSFIAFLLGLISAFSWSYLSPSTESAALTETEARQIAEASCIKGGYVLDRGVYNEVTKTWWFDANLNMTRPGCNPVCVVTEETLSVEINWRCTGLSPIPEPTKTTISNFKECAAAGNPIMESYPRQCRADGQTFVEVISESIACTPDQRQAEACTFEYMPVCGKVSIRCVTAPCDPIFETFPNKCAACINPLVESYTDGECPAE